MAVRIIHDDRGAVLYCSTDMEAFGPVFNAVEEAEDFLEWLPDDARNYGHSALSAMYDRWHELAYDQEGHWAGRVDITP